jgi:hypothetical protein
MKLSLLELVTLMLFAIFAVEAIHRFTLIPEKPIDEVVKIRDPMRPPEAFFQNCRAEGKLTMASRFDEGPWTYECY